MKPRQKLLFALTAAAAVVAAVMLVGHVREQRALHSLEQQAEAGNVADQLRLGERYLDRQEIAQAAYWLGKAAAQGSHGAVDKLGVIAYYLQSKVQPTAEEQRLAAEIEQPLAAQRRPETVLDVYRRRAAEGDTDVLISLGLMYRRGEGAPQDYAEAMRYFERYAATKNTRDPGRGEYYLGWMYDEGQGVAASEEKMLSLFSQSCDRHFRLACYELGERYYQGGKTYAPDYQKASALLDVFAADRTADSQALRHIDHLFTMYRDGGHGIAKNPERIEAIKRQLCAGGSESEMCDAPSAAE